MTNNLSVDNDTNTASSSGNQATSSAYQQLPTKGWHRIALAIIVLLAAFLNFFRLDQNGFGNIYYAAGVKSMLMSWHNFFFVSFDPGGFVSLDKPPVAFWIQAASAWLFGFSGFSLLLPEVLAGIASVAVLYVLVRRAFGPIAGLLAALALALTPVAVAINRNNTPDSLLLLCVLLATWAVSIAAETGHLRWLLLTALLVGLGFNIKMLQAYLVLPAFILLYLLTAPIALRVRLLHLLLAAVVLVAVSLSWVLAVDLTPASQRPYVGSSATNSAVDLAFGYNGLNRITGMKLSNSAEGANAGSSQISGFILLVSLGETGFPSPIRLLNAQLGSQIGWLLLFAVFGLIVVWGWRMPRVPLNRQQQALMLWGTWFLVMFVFFSVSLIPHSYYLAMLAPALCAFVGIGAIKLWGAYRSSGWRGWLLPIALAATAAAQMLILSYDPEWRARLLPLLGVFCVLPVVLVGMRLFAARRAPLWSSRIALLSMLALLIVPSLWSFATTWQKDDTVSVVAGPHQIGSSLTSLIGSFLPQVEHANPALEHYLLAHQGRTRYLAATLNASSAAPLILDTGKPVMALGGFIGSDPILTSQQLQTLVDNGTVRYVLLPSLKIDINKLPPQILKIIINAFKGKSPQGSKGNASFPMQNDVLHWVTQHCTPVQANRVQPGALAANTVPLGTDGTAPVVLFDCAQRR